MNPSFKTAKNTLQELNQILSNRHYSLDQRVQHYNQTMQQFANLTQDLSDDEKTSLQPLRAQAREIYENLNHRLNLAKAVSARFAAEAEEEGARLLLERLVSRAAEMKRYILPTIDPKLLEESHAVHQTLIQTAEANLKLAVEKRLAAEANLRLAKAAADEEEIERLRVEAVARQTNLLIEDISTHIQDLVLSLKVKPQNLEKELLEVLDKFHTSQDSNELMTSFRKLLDVKRFPQNLSQQCVDAIKTFLNAIGTILSLGYSPRFFQTQNMRIQAQTQDFLDQVSITLG